MNDVRCQISVSLDGFVAGPNQSHDNPIGEGGMRLHEWAFLTDSWRSQHGLDGDEHNADAEVIDDAFQGAGAGERLLDNVGDPTLEPVKVVASPAASHIKYRVIH